MAVGHSQTIASLDSFLTSTGPTYARGYIETQFKKHVVMSRLMKGNRVQTHQEGGRSIVKRIIYGINPTIKLRGPNQDVDLQESEFITNAEWPWGSMTGALTFKDDDIKKNRGNAQLVEWTQPKLQQAMNTVDQQLSWWLGQGNQGRIDDTTRFDKTADTLNNVIFGLRDAIAPGDTNTSRVAGGYGSIALADLGPSGIFTDWFAPTIDANANGGPGALPHLLLKSLQTTVHGSYPVDFIVTDLNGWTTYADMSYPNVVQSSFAGAGETIFDSYKVGGKDLVWDVDVTPMLTGQDTGGSLVGAWGGTADLASTSRYYGVATQSMAFYWNPDWNYDNAVEPGWRIPENGFRRSKLINLQCQFICEDRRSNFLLYNVASG